MYYSQWKVLDYVTSFKEEVDKYYTNNKMSSKVDQKLSKQNFHSHLADISLQNDASMHHNMDVLLDHLREKI